MSKDALGTIRDIAVALPEVTERLSHGAPCFYVRKRPLCCYHDGDFSSDGRVSIWFPAPPGAQQQVIDADPGRYFAPTPSASGVFKDWIGAYIDGTGAAEPNWNQLADLIEEAFRHIAPKTLVAKLE